MILFLCTCLGVLSWQAWTAELTGPEVCRNAHSTHKQARPPIHRATLAIQDNPTQLHTATHTHSCIHAYPSTFTYTRSRTYVHSYARSIIHSHVRTSIHTYVQHTHTHTHTHTHACGTYIHMYVETTRHLQKDKRDQPRENLRMHLARQFTSVYLSCLGCGCKDRC